MRTGPRLIVANFGRRPDPIEALRKPSAQRKVMGSMYRRHPARLVAAVNALTTEYATGVCATGRMCKMPAFVGYLYTGEAPRAPDIHP